MESKKIWITWEKQRRNKSMCSKLGVVCHELISSKRGFLRYLELSVRTILLIQREGTDVLFVQNPSIVLSFLAVMFKPFKGYRLVVDEHNAGIFPLEGRSFLLNAIARFIARNADFVIVTNAPLQELCEGWGARVFIIPDPLPDFSFLSEHDHNRTKRVSDAIVMLFICTWADDEPYHRLISAAEKFDKNSLVIKITGDPKDKIDKSKLPSNVVLTGFIPDDEYVRELMDCDGVVVLTTREDCLNCGGYEAVSLEKPGVLSDTSALRNYFSKGFVFSSPRSEKSLVQGIEKFMRDRERLEREVVLLKMELSSCTDSFQRLTEALATPSRNHNVQK